MCASDGLYCVYVCMFDCMYLCVCMYVDVCVYMFMNVVMVCMHVVVMVCVYVCIFGSLLQFELVLLFALIFQSIPLSLSLSGWCLLTLSLCSPCTLPELVVCCVAQSPELFALFFSL